MAKRLQRPKRSEAHRSSHRAFDAAALKRQFPSLIDARLHYLDSAATAHMPNVVLNALLCFELEARANVHEGQHRLARAATDAYHGARDRVARFVHAHSTDEVIFTYGATSAINLLAYSLGRLLQPGDEVLLSVLEHHSNLVPWQELAQRRGIILRYVPITPDGRLDLDWLEAEVSNRCRLVALTHCSNVTGALTDVARVVAAARSVGAKVMLDGAQRAPHGPLDVRSLGVDFYVFSGHKTYGPTGIGVLWGRQELLEALPPFLTGGQMIDEVTLTSASFRRPPRRFEAGTPPIAAAIGLGAALDWMQSLDWRAIQHHETRLTRRILEGLASLPGVRVAGPLDTHDRRGVVAFYVEGYSTQDVCRHLDERGVALRGGHHCAQPLARALGFAGTARASLAPYSLDEDVDELLEGLGDLARGRALPQRRRPPQRAVKRTKA